MLLPGYQAVCLCMPMASLEAMKATTEFSKWPPLPWNNEQTELYFMKVEFVNCESFYAS